MIKIINVLVVTSLFMVQKGKTYLNNKYQILVIAMEDEDENGMFMCTIIKMENNDNASAEYDIAIANEFSECCIGLTNIIHLN